MKIPLPAIVFIAVLGGCIIILCILYQLLKRGKCCQVHGREGGEEEELEELIANGDGGNAENGEIANQGNTEQTDGPLLTPVSRNPETGSVIPAEESPNAGALTGNTTIDLSISDASFPSVNLLPIEEQTPVSNCGEILLETTFSPVANKMIISVIRAANVPGVDRGGTPMVEVHLSILPNKKWKFRTSAKPSNSPVFNERYTLYPVNLKMLEEMSIRIRLYGKKTFGKKVLGEVEVPMTEIDLHSDLSDEPMWKTLLPYGMVAKLAALRETGEDEEFEMMANEDDA